MAKASKAYQHTTMKQSLVCDLFNAHQIMDDGRNGFSDSIFKNGEDFDSYLTSSSSSSTPSSSYSSSELEEDASSSFSPLFELSELMATLPIKRGLSKYYDGKSESFTSLASVGNLEDLAKKGSSCSQRIKSCRSNNGWGLGDCRKYGPKATITKRTSTNSKRSFLAPRGDTSTTSCRTSLFLNNNF